MSERVRPDSLVTLHYRLALADDQELVSTFGGNPATLQLGSGELAPTLEACLDGVEVGERHVFLLEAEQAFGARNEQLLHRLARSALPKGVEPEIHGQIEFTDEAGRKLTGTVSAMDDAGVLVDFNHPLAGRAVRFEVEIIGIL